ncbi:MAG: endolytic transglycosylase MltG [Anaerotignum sp.]|nr:endolytic transglycosylase MltG [Anaerotignum sp.]
MDDRFDRESNTRYPRRESAVLDGNTRYPRREDRRTVSFGTESVRNTERETSSQNSTEWDRFLKETQAEPQGTEHFSGEDDSMRQRRRTSNDRKPQKKRRKKRHLTGAAKLIILIVVALVVGGGMFFTMNRLMNPPAEETNLSGTTVSVTIPEGAGTQDIAEILKENDLIGSVFGFKLTSKMEGFDGTYKCGTYSIDTGMTKRQIMELLQSGKVASDLKLMIPEGNTVRQIAVRVEEAGICTAEEFINEANTGTFDYEFLKDLPEREYRLEGYLFPDTYFLSESMTAHDVINTMLKRFDQMYTEEYRNAVASSGHTLDEIVTLASMVEKEIKLPEERARAAGVMYNRLRDGITLGIDATVLYAVGKTAGELTQADLNTDSPYNTRINYGLPLGPIANPGEASFKAALYPETHNYLYYVVEAVGKDNHIYCETYDEFLTAKAAYNASAQ